jgi:hypothetical protein
LNKSNSFEDIVNSIDRLTESEQDTLLYILEKDKIQRNTCVLPKRFLKLYFIIFSSIWFVAILGGGLLDIQPVWFRYMLFPLLGIPFSISHVLDIIKYKSRKDFKEFLVISFFAGPIIGFFWGLILWFIIYYVWKLFS